MSTPFLPELVSVRPFITKISICIPENESDSLKRGLPHGSPLNYGCLFKCLTETPNAAEGQFSMDTPQMAHQSVIDCKIRMSNVL